MDKSEGEWASWTSAERAAFIASLEDKMDAPITTIDVRTGKTPFWATGCKASVAVRKGQPMAPRKPKVPRDPNAPKRPRGRPPKPKPLDV